MTMHKKTNIIKGLAIGATALTAAIAATNVIKGNSYKARNIKRKAGRALKTAGSTITDFSYMFK